MPSDETAFLDPIEFSPGRIEVGLDELGLYIKEADWGESDIDLFLVRRAHGEIPADTHPPNRQIVIKIGAKEKSGMKLAQVVSRLEAKAALIQEQEGWIKRKADTKSGHLVQVAYPVRKLAFMGLQGWLMAHRQHAEEITLTITAGPYCYSTTPQILASSEGEGRSLVYTIAKTLGTAPGLIRHAITNKNVSGHWQGCVLASETRDYTAGPAALTEYNCEALTEMIGAEEITDEESGTGKVVEFAGAYAVANQIPAETFQAMLNSKIAGVGHMNHKGNRRFLLRAKAGDGGGINDRDAELRLEYRVLGTTEWTRNDAAKFKVWGAYTILDLGEVRLGESVLGEQRWEWRISGRATKYKNQITFWLDVVWILPTEQYAVAREGLRISDPADYVARYDKFFGEGEKITGSNVSFPYGGNPVTGSGDLDDFNGIYASTTMFATRTAVSDAVASIGVHNGRIATLAWLSAQTSQAVTIDVSQSAGQASGAEDSYGAILRYVNISNFLTVRVQRSGVNNSGWVSIYKRVGGFYSSIAAKSFTLGSIEEVQRLRVVVMASGAFICYCGPVGQERFMFAGYDSQLATGGPLASGAPGWYDYRTAATATTRRFANFGVWVPDEAVVCYAGRQMEFRSEGVFRQHQTDEVWAELTPDGFLPYAQPSRLEGLPTRLTVVPTSGDLEYKADVGINKMKLAPMYFPGYHFLSEAA